MFVTPQTGLVEKKVKKTQLWSSSVEPVVEGNKQILGTPFLPFDWTWVLQNKALYLYSHSFVGLWYFYVVLKMNVFKMAKRKMLSNRTVLPELHDYLQH